MIIQYVHRVDLDNLLTKEHSNLTYFVISKLLSHAKNTHTHPVFSHCVGNMVLKPNRTHIKRGSIIEHVGMCTFLQIRKAGLCNRIGPASVDPHH